MRIIFLGSPECAVPPLEALIQAGYEVVAVVTQPDKPAGRKQVLTPPPVKLAAQQHHIPVLQPPDMSNAEVVEQIAAYQPDVGVVAAYGELLRKRVRAIPPLGYLNIHPSLLPLYRGPSPVVGAILAGDTEVGVTIMKLEAKMDSGPILAQVTVPLLPTARTGALTDELFRLGAQVLQEVLPHYVSGQLVPRPQDDSQASYTTMLTRADGLINWSLPALVIERRTRAYDPWPAAHTIWRNQPFKVVSAQVCADWSGTDVPGTLVGVDAAGAPMVATGSGALALYDVQPAGRRCMTGREWLHGQRGAVVGQQFGGESVIQ